MAVYAVQYSYPDDVTEMLTHRPEHRAFLNASPGLLLAGALKEEFREVVGSDSSLPSQGTQNGGLLIFESPSIDELEELLDRDPYYTKGFISRRLIREWDPPLGTLTTVG